MFPPCESCVFLCIAYTECDAKDVIQATAAQKLRKNLKFVSASSSICFNLFDDKALYPFRRHTAACVPLLHRAIGGPEEIGELLDV